MKFSNNSHFFYPILLLLIFSLCFGISPAAVEFTADLLNVLEADEQLPDLRQAAWKTAETTHTFIPPATLKEWERRRGELRERILVSCGLLPMPERCSLEPQVFERREHTDYTVEKVLLRTYPGYYLTGNLYRPNKTGQNKKYPAILSPHGHWPNGRFENTEMASVPGRAISFARQGYVCFSYDMVGYGDNSRILPDHTIGGLSGRQWGIHSAGLQLWNSLRAREFLQGLPDVDAEEIGCTGASGGGTQTFLLAAVDDRIKVAAPVNMISHTFQGGCLCENPPLLRLDSDNVEFGAMMAPRPLILVAASGDWTRATLEVEYPAIRSVYRLYGAEDKITAHRENAGHNYNRASREAVYAWFGKWFFPALKNEDFLEKPFKVDALEDLQVFARREAPKDVLQPEALFSELRNARRRQIQEYLKKGRAAYEETFGRAYRVTVGVGELDPAEIKLERPVEIQREEIQLNKFVMRNEKTGQQIPANLWLPSKTNGAKLNYPVLLLHEEGKAGAFEESGQLLPILKEKLQQRHPVLMIDHHQTGEVALEWNAFMERTQHFDTYNLSLPACQIQDILLAETWLAERFKSPPKIIGLKNTGALVLLAHGLANRSRGAVADLTDFDFNFAFDEEHGFFSYLDIPNIRNAGDFVSSIVAGGKRSVEWHGVSDPEIERELQQARLVASQ